MTTRISSSLAAWFLLTAVAFCGPMADSDGARSTGSRARTPAVFREASVEAGILAGLNNPNDYVLAPVSFGWTARARQAVPLGGTGWILRPGLRGTLGVVPVVNGPESLWVGVLLGPEFLLGDPKSRFHWFIRLQGGVGAVDSSGRPEAQTHDFTLSVVAAAGLRHELSESLWLTLGLHYQHISNGGLSEPDLPNTGLDSVGPIIGLTWAF